MMVVVFILVVPNNLAVDFDSNATQDDENCIIFGCTIDLYPNYNPAATLEDFSCDIGNSLDIYGCTDIEFVEFNPNANIDNGTCSLLTIEGCTDTLSVIMILMLLMMTVLVHTLQHAYNDCDSMCMLILMEMGL